MAQPTPASTRSRSGASKAAAASKKAAYRTLPEIPIAELDELDTRLLAESLTDFGLRTDVSTFIMQLSHPGVAERVLREDARSGGSHAYLVARNRMTWNGIAVAAIGSAHDRNAYREALRSRRFDGGHAHLDTEMPDAERLWIAACIYLSLEDVYDRVYGPMFGATLDRFYGEGVSIAATFQVPSELWPATREDMDAYWQSMLPQLSINKEVRSYLLRVAKTGMVPRWLRRRSTLESQLDALGFLPPEIRKLLRLKWITEHQDVFNDRTTAGVERARKKSRWAHLLPYRLLLWNMHL